MAARLSNQRHVAYQAFPMLGFFTDDRFGNNRSLIAAISCAGVCGIVFGLSMPLISLRLEMMTNSGLLVGMNGAAAAMSTLIMAPLVPRLIAYVHPRIVLPLALVSAALLHAAFPLLENVTAWFALRFVMGCFMTVIFVISETWINQIATPERRATILGVYGTALSGGFGVGALIFGMVGAQADTGFYAGAAIFVMGIAPVLFLRGPQAVAPDAEEASLGAMLGCLRVAPAAIAAGLAFGALETLLFSMVPVYGTRIGLTEAMISQVAIAAAIGALLSQIPLGWIADKTGRRLTLTWIAAVATLAPLMVWLAGTNMPSLLALVLVQAGVASGLYTVGLALLGERFTGGAIAAANAAFIFAYGLGSLFAPPLAGQGMDGLGAPGLMWIMSAIAGAYLLFLLLRRNSPSTES